MQKKPFYKIQHLCMERTLKKLGRKGICHDHSNTIFNWKLNLYHLVFITNISIWIVFHFHLFVETICSPKNRNKERLSTLTTLTQHTQGSTGSPSQRNWCSTAVGKILKVMPLNHFCCCFSTCQHPSRMQCIKTAKTMPQLLFSLVIPLKLDLINVHRTASPGTLS